MRYLNYSHVENADPAGVRSDAGDIVLEGAWEVGALACVEAIVVAVARPVVVGADVDVSIDLGTVGVTSGKLRITRWSLTKSIRSDV